MFEHAVEDAEQLPHAGGKGQFLGLTSGTETLVEGLDNRVVPGRDQRPHVQRGPHPSSSTPHCALSSEGTAVSVERSNTHEAGDPPAVQRTQFRQLSQQGQRQYLTNTWDATQQIVLLAPQGTLPERVSQVGIQLGHVLLQPSYVALDLPSHRARSRMEPVLLRSNHRYQLPPPSQQCRQGLSLGVRQRPRRRFHCFSESGENTRIQPVSLGQLAGCTREVSNLAWIDHHHRQLRRCQRSRQRKLLPPAAAERPTLTSILSLRERRLPLLPSREKAGMRGRFGSDGRLLSLACCRGAASPSPQSSPSGRGGTSD